MAVSVGPRWTLVQPRLGSGTNLLHKFHEPDPPVLSLPLLNLLLHERHVCAERDNLAVVVVDEVVGVALDELIPV